MNAMRRSTQGIVNFSLSLPLTLPALLKVLLLTLGGCWLTLAQAADTGWITQPQNTHAQVRLRAERSLSPPVRLLLDIRLQDGWKTYWRTPGEGGIAPSIRWDDQPEAVQWFWPTPQRFDVAGLTTQGYHHQATLPITLASSMGNKLSGTLTLSTCSNVCVLTDFPFSLDMQAPGDQGFAQDFERAMDNIPKAGALTKTLRAGYHTAELQITATREGGWSRPALFLDDVGETSFGKPILTVKGETMQARVPVSDAWSDNPPDLRGQYVSLVLEDGGIAQQSQLKIGDPGPSVGRDIALWQTIVLALAVLAFGWISILTLRWLRNPSRNSL